MNAITNHKRILFVDDEFNILQGLRRMLRCMRNEWELDFANSGEEALDKMKESSFDIIISDMRMPGMDGVRLLNLVKDLYPGMVRFILSGHADKEMIIRSVGPTHQFLSKPCDPGVLKAAVAKAFALRELLDNDQVINIVKDSSTLPTLPELYHKLTIALNSPNATAEDIAGIIAQDVSMTAKILQLVNSAFFGLPREVDNINQAVALLGIETINSIVLTSSAFEQFEEKDIKQFNIRGIYNHSIATGVHAGDIVKRYLRSRKLAEEATLAGMTHDLGKLVLASNDATEWQRVVDRHQLENVPLCLAEEEIIGVTHAEVGAYTLGLWGINDDIVEAVAFHHQPLRSHSTKLDIVAALHIADVLQHRISGTPGPELDLEFIEKIGITDVVTEFEEMISKGC